MSEEQAGQLLPLVKEYLNVYHNEDDIMIKMFINTSYQYILDYTGLTDEEYKSKEQTLNMCLFLLVSQLYESRGLESLQIRQNTLLKSLLNIYSKNYV